MTNNSIDKLICSGASTSYSVLKLIHSKETLMVFDVHFMTCKRCNVSFHITTSAWTHESISFWQPTETCNIYHVCFCSWLPHLSNIGNHGDSRQCSLVSRMDPLSEYNQMMLNFISLSCITVTSDISYMVKLQNLTLWCCFEQNSCERKKHT